MTFECTLTKDGVKGTPEEDCTSPKVYEDLGAGTYTFSVVGIDEIGNRSEPQVSEPWTVTAPPDTTAPVVEVALTPNGASSASFALTANEANVTFECQLTRSVKVNERKWAACETPVEYTDQKPGTYYFSARATDAAGNVSAAVTVLWTVSRTAR